VAVVITLTIIIELPGLSMRSHAVSTADMRSWNPLAAGADFDGLLRAKVPPLPGVRPRPLAGILGQARWRDVDRNTYAP
jgi:hypothetical protein